MIALSVAITDANGGAHSEMAIRHHGDVVEHERQSGHVVQLLACLLLDLVLGKPRPDFSPMGWDMGDDLLWFELRRLDRPEAPQP